MITEFRPWIRAAYLVVDLIFNDSFGTLGEICLLVPIYYLIFRLHRQTGTTYDNDKKTLLWAHYGFCGILAIFYLAMFGLQMHDLYNAVFHPYTDRGPAEYKGILDLGIIFVVYNVLYLCAALEILALSLWLLKQGNLMHTRKTVRFSIPQALHELIPQQPGLLLLGLISMPLLTRSVFELAVSITSNIILANLNETIGLIIAIYVIDGLCWLLVFIGIVLISNQDSSSPTPTPFNIESMQAATAGVLIADRSGSSSN